MTNANSLVRCAWCDNATDAVRRVASLEPCAACRDKPHYRAICPLCGGGVFLDPTAGAAFCGECEFTLDLGTSEDLQSPGVKPDESA